MDARVETKLWEVSDMVAMTEEWEADNGSAGTSI